MIAFSHKLYKDALVEITTNKGLIYYFTYKDLFTYRNGIEVLDEIELAELNRYLRFVSIVTVFP